MPIDYAHIVNKDVLKKFMQICELVELKGGVGGMFSGAGDKSFALIDDIQVNMPIGYVDLFLNKGYIVGEKDQYCTISDDGWDIYYHFKKSPFKRWVSKNLGAFLKFIKWIVGLVIPKI